MEESLKAKRSDLAKIDAKMVVAIIVLALAVILFICDVVSIADTTEDFKEQYGDIMYGNLNSATYKAYKEALRTLQITCTQIIMKHIVNMAIASLIVGVFAKKRSEIASEIKSRNVIKLEANTIPCPKCEAEIERNDAEHSLQCSNCGASYKNPFYKG